MVDVISSTVRSALMSRIRAKNTKPELIVRKLLWGRGFRFRLHSKGLAGSPDLVLRKWKAAVFVNGCFWHRHSNCSQFRLPKTRTAFWDSKLLANRQRDRVAIDLLQRMGWRVVVVWECAVRINPEEASSQLATWLTGAGAGAEIRAYDGAVITQHSEGEMR